MTTPPLTIQQHLDQNQLDDRLIGRRLKSLRQQVCIEPQELADMSRIPLDELEDYKAGRLPLGITRMRQLASALDTDAMTLLARLLFPLC